MSFDFGESVSRSLLCCGRKPGAVGGGEDQPYSYYTHVKERELSDVTAAQVEDGSRCACGSTYLDDSLYCRKCGVKRKLPPSPPPSACGRRVCCMCIICLVVVLLVILVIVINVVLNSEGSSSESSSSSSLSPSAAALAVDGGSGGGGGTASASVVPASPPGPATPSSLSFYMYRTQASGSTYLPENMNTADLAGVLWYLHNDVVVQAPRKYRIDVIRRWKVTIKPTQEYWNIHHRMFGAFAAFDSGRCLAQGCDKAFQHYGYLVGCAQAVDGQQSGYRTSSKTLDCQGKTGGAGQCLPTAPIWYSLPGACPLKAYASGGDSGKDSDCITANPGGRCDAPSGAPDCTYSVEDAGNISISKLVGFESEEAYNDWWKADPDNTEYVNQLLDGTVVDGGVGMHWWNQKYDVAHCAARVQAAQDMFRENFPGFPDLDEPMCDYKPWDAGELDLPLNHTLGIDPERGFVWSG